MQTLSELVYQQDAKMGETEHATLTDSSSADKPSQPTSPALEPKNSGTLPILEVGEGSLQTPQASLMSPISSGTSRSRVSTTSLRFSEFVLGTSLISQTDSQANISGNEPTFDESTNTNLSFIPNEIPDDHGITDSTTPRRSGRCPQDTVTSTPSHNIFYGAKELGDAIQSHIFKLPWPPNSQNLTLSTAEDAVPPLLYNFLASACGLTDQATLPDALELNKLSPADHSKLLSICQDIVNLQSRGKVTTPKSLSLGISVKHRTGSSDLI